MRVLFDHGVPAPLRKSVPAHTIATAHEMGWATLTNGELLAAAEQSFDAFVTTDRNLKYQQNLTGRRLAILVLPTTSWPILRVHAPAIAAALDGLVPGQYLDLALGD